MSCVKPCLPGSRISFFGILITLFLLTPPLKAQSIIDQLEFGMGVQHDFNVAPFKPQTSLVPEIMVERWVVQLTEQSHLRASLYVNYRDDNLSQETIYENTNQAYDFWSTTVGARAGLVSTFGVFPLQLFIGLNYQYLDFTYREEAPENISEDVDFLLEVLGKTKGDFAIQQWAWETGMSFIWPVVSRFYLKAEPKFYVPMDDNTYNMNRFYFKIGLGFFI